MYLNKYQLIQWIEEAGQVEQAVNNVLREHAKEYHDEILVELVHTSMNCRLFKGARRAASHISEPGRYIIVSNMISCHKRGFGFKKDQFFFTAWLETIKMCSESNRSYELLEFVSFITQRYSPSRHLASLVEEALGLIHSADRKPIPHYGDRQEEWEDAVLGLEFEQVRVLYPRRCRFD